jgi:hypothetical protein
VTRLDQDLVPEVAVRPSHENGDYHTGRGGAGNEHIAKKAEEDKKAAAAAEGPAAPVGLADRLKKKVLGLFGKK